MKKLLNKNNWLTYFVLSVISGLIIAFFLHWQSQGFYERTQYYFSPYISFWEIWIVLSVSLFLFYLNFKLYSFKNIILKIIPILWGIFSLGVSLLMVFAAWEHNPQQEFHIGNSLIDWVSLTALFLSWFVFLLLIQIIVTVLSKGVYKLLKSKR